MLAEQFLESNLNIEWRKLPPGMGLVITVTAWHSWQNLFIINRFDPSYCSLLICYHGYLQSQKRENTLSVRETSLGQQDNILTFEFASWYFGTRRVLRINWFWPQVDSVKTFELEFWLQWKVLREGRDVKWKYESSYYQISISCSPPHLACQPDIVS